MTEDQAQSVLMARGALSALNEIEEATELARRVLGEANRITGSGQASSSEPPLCSLLRTAHLLLSTVPCKVQPRDTVPAPG
jgi:hypothetical protein